jgi:protein BCP1
MPKRRRETHGSAPPSDGGVVDEKESRESDADDWSESSGSSDEEVDVSSEEEESEDDEDGQAFDSVQVDFEFFDPQDKDFLGLKTLLRGYLTGQEYACSELVEAVIAQVCDRSGAARLSALLLTFTGR